MNLKGQNINRICSCWVSLYVDACSSKTQPSLFIACRRVSSRLESCAPSQHFFLLSTFALPSRHNSIISPLYIFPRRTQLSTITYGPLAQTVKIMFVPFVHCVGNSQAQFPSLSAPISCAMSPCSSRTLLSGLCCSFASSSLLTFRFCSFFILLESRFFRMLCQKSAARRTIIITPKKAPTPIPAFAPVENEGCEKEDVAMGFDD